MSVIAIIMTTTMNTVPGNVSTVPAYIAGSAVKLMSKPIRETNAAIDCIMPEM